MTNIAEITTRTRDSMEQMHGSMEQLARLAGSLLAGINVFQLGPAYAAPAHGPNGGRDLSGVVAPSGWTSGLGTGVPAGFPFQSGPLPFQSESIPYQAGPPSGSLFDRTDTTQPMTMMPPETLAAPAAPAPTGGTPPLGSGALARPANTTRPVAPPTGPLTPIPDGFAPPPDASAPNGLPAMANHPEADIRRPDDGAYAAPVPSPPPWPR
jgi:hypothetical protein